MSCCTTECKQKLVAAISITGAFLIMGSVVWLTRHYNRVPGPDYVRAAERTKNLKELNGVNHKVLEEYDWQDKSKGFVRLPIKRAMELTAEEWQNPAKARAAMAEKVDRLTALPPKPPEKKSDFE